MATLLVDESYRHDLERYVLAGICIEHTQEESLRALLEAFLVPGQHRLHWRKSGKAGRARLTDLLRSVKPPAVVAIARNVRPRGQREARRACWLQLLENLDGYGVEELLIEHSDEYGHADDRRALISARRRGGFDPKISYRHVDPVDEPLLWLADIAAGVVQAGAVSWPGLVVIDA